MAAIDLVRLRAQLGARGIAALSALEMADERAQSTEAAQAAASFLGLDWPELDQLLPDGALPAGVTEIASPGLSASAFGARAVRAAHRRDGEAFCAWLEPEGTLYAPGLAAAGVDLERLIVARPARTELGRLAVKMAASGAFDVVVVDMDPPRAMSDRTKGQMRGAPSKRRVRAWPGEVLVRKLALAVEDGKTHVVLLTDAEKPRATSWPVGLRLEVVRRADGWRVAIGKERFGRIGRTGDVALLEQQVARGPSIARSVPVASAAGTIANLASLVEHARRSAG